MQGKVLFEYAVVRLVPRVEREEFLNIGVILYCREQKFLDMQYVLDRDKLRIFSFGNRIAEVECYLEAFRTVCEGKHNGGPIALLPIAERFRWLTAKRSTIIQLSAVHPGFCDDAQVTLQRLYETFVL